MKKQLNLNIVYYIACGLIGLGLILLSVFLFKFSNVELFSRLKGELREIYTVDHSLYFTVSRGMLAGEKPYSGYYENKPPLIFLLGAISWKLFHNYLMVNVLAFISLVIILVLPITLLVIKCIQNKTDPVVAVIMGVPTFFVSVLLVMYTVFDTMNAQVELFGDTASIITIFVLAIFSKNEKKFYSPTVILSGFFLGVAAMFKEPHAALCACLMLLMVRNKKDLLYKFLIPLGYAIVTIFFILIICNCADTYFTIYLKNMLSAHINIYGNPFVRAWQFQRILNHLILYSKDLPNILLTLFIVAVLSTAARIVFDDTLEKRLFSVMRLLMLFVSIYAAAFVVGLGGQYFYHHCAFAIPFYFQFIFTIFEEFPFDKVKFKDQVQENKFQVKKTIIPALSLIVTLLLSPMMMNAYKNSNQLPSKETYAQETPNAKEVARYIDEVCDALNLEHYLFIGFTGHNPNLYSEHLPYGPSFAQDPQNFKTADTYWAKEFTMDLHACSFIVFYDAKYLNAIKDESLQYIADNFTTLLPAEVKDIEPPHYVTDRHFGFLFRNTLIPPFTPCEGDTCPK